MAVNQEEENVPEHLFAHVEMSMESRIKEGMLLEFLHNPDPKAYWIASVTMICGHLLRIKYIGSDEDFWIDINNKPIHPIGWCGKYDELIEAPEEIKKQHGDNLITMLQDAITKGLSIPNDYNMNNGLTAIDRVKPNMKLEIQNKNDPYKYWIATVKENIGGRLLLQYVAPENIFDSFWIFYSSPRIKPLGYTQLKKPPWVLKSPHISRQNAGISSFFSTTCT